MEKRHLVLVAIIFISFSIRVINLDVIPTWAWDEGVNENISKNLGEGRWQWFSIKYLWIPHPPLYYLIASFRPVLGLEPITSLRLLSVFFSVLTAYLIYLSARLISGELTGLFSALVFSLFPTAIYWNRMAYANNQIMFLFVLIFYLILSFSKTGNKKTLYLSSFLMGLIILTEYFGLTFLIALVFYIKWYHPKEVRASLIIALLMPLAFLAYMFFVGGSEFVQDLTFEINRVNAIGNSAPLTIFLGTTSIFLLFIFSNRLKTKFHDLTYIKLKTLGPNILFMYLPLTLLIVLFPPTDAISMNIIDFFLVVAIMGFAVCDVERSRTLLWFSFGACWMILGGLGRTDHMVLPSYPILSIGCGIFFSKLYDSRKVLNSLFSQRLGRNIANGLVIVLLTYPLIILIYQDYNAFILKNGLIELDRGNIEVLNSFINERVSEDDLVLTQSYFANALNCRSSLIAQAITYEGDGIAYYRKNRPKNRFYFNTSVQAAKYILIPRGLFESFEQVGYVDFAKRLKGFELVYSQEDVQVKRSTMPKMIWGWLGVPENISATAYEIYENKNLGS